MEDKLQYRPQLLGRKVEVRRVETTLRTRPQEYDFPKAIERK